MTAQPLINKDVLQLDGSLGHLTGIKPMPSDKSDIRSINRDDARRIPFRVCFQLFWIRPQIFLMVVCEFLGEIGEGLEISVSFRFSNCNFHSLSVYPRFAGKS